MRKIFKSKKALSPVVAAIILIAVTVAVSIAVAAWMGALTFTFMKTEELKVQSHTWATNRTSISLTMKNTGTGALTVTEVRVNDVAVSNVTIGVTPLGSGYTMDAGALATFTVDAPVGSATFTSGVKYEFAALTATGNKFTYVATAP
ncbi:MAG TPA: archaellin/type IV pilin N-terminal domain-containing protein [Candidatus Bathyarchaeia archaeon]|nr:archaellin/type IV pilin N-terminal domain-containing protein [Candidatus Bathyarchaeia archaeon]